MAATTAYGRNRQSIADLEQELNDLFQDHPASTLNDANEPSIPADALVDILRTFSRNHDSELISKDEEDQLANLVESNPGIQVSPQILLQFIAMRTSNGPNEEPEGSSTSSSPNADDRGRDEERGQYAHRSRSRSSSQGSPTVPVFKQPSRPPSRGPSAPPKTPLKDSPFDASKRQRTTLLTTGPPSSWSRRPPPHRRTSDAGHYSSDSDSGAPAPSFARRTVSNMTSRSRVPSRGASPEPWHSISSSGRRNSGTFSPPSTITPYGGTYSRPHSRTQSLPQNSLDDYRFGGSPDRADQYGQRTGSAMGLLSPPPSDLSETSFGDETDEDGVNAVTLPSLHTDEMDSDSDDEDDTAFGLLQDRTATVSTISLDYQERLEAMQKTNEDLGRKLIEAERTLQVRLADHENEIEEMQGRIEELRSELSATKREEKELRAKERTNAAQISALESEIAKLQKSLDNSRSAYMTLQKQYLEQCAECERYRNSLRQRDEEFKTLLDNNSLQSLELERMQRESERWNMQVHALEEELEIAQQAAAALDEQKQENLMLKETIDRMRFEMDEMRVSNALNVAGIGANGTSSAGSIRGSVGKSLGAELMRGIKGDNMPDWVIGEEDEDEEQVEEEVEEGSTDGEDVIQHTIITRTKRKVPSRAKAINIGTLKLEEVKEYSDTAVQHDVAETTRTFSIQTDPEPKVLTTSFSIQTDPEPSRSEIEMQTDPEPAPVPTMLISMEIQTEPEPEPEGGEARTEVAAEVVSMGVQTQAQEEDIESLASSSTLLPPTPKASSTSLVDASPAQDLPPSYTQSALTHHHETPDELATRVASETLAKCHPGLKLPLDQITGLPEGVSEEAVEEWRTLKKELGVSCEVVDRLVEANRTGLSRGQRRRSRFYNIYNTYVYGDKDGGSPERRSGGLLSSQFLFCIGASAAVAFLVGSAMAPTQYGMVPGGATYYDRAAWASFNALGATGEGFGDAYGYGMGGHGGYAAIWKLFGKLTGNAARTLRGWPT